MKYYILSFALLVGMNAFAKHSEVGSPSSGGDGGRLLTLEQCLERAKQNNHELRQAALEIEAAAEQKREAFTNYFPRISANVMAFRCFDEMVKTSGTYPKEIAAISPQFAPLIGMPYSIEEFNRAYAVSGTLVQPLYYGGQNRLWQQTRPRAGRRDDAQAAQ